MGHRTGNSYILRAQAVEIEL